MYFLAGFNLIIIIQPCDFFSHVYYAKRSNVVYNSWSDVYQPGDSFEEREQRNRKQLLLTYLLAILAYTYTTMYPILAYIYHVTLYTQCTYYTMYPIPTGLHLPCTLYT